jgi:two-component system phosphate regulon response regulator OmpR
LSDEATPALRIWVVDDDPDLRQLLAEVLGQQGYEVRCLNDGGQLLTWLQRQRPDLVVLDLMLPGDDGLKLLRQLRDAGDDLPVLMLTARADGVGWIESLAWSSVGCGPSASPGPLPIWLTMPSAMAAPHCE